MHLPNFLIIGAGRTGTTSLYYYLRQHPEIYMSPIKEPRFFLYEGTKREDIKGKDRWVKETMTTLADYQKLFAGVTTEKAIGEASVEYFYHPVACRNIHKRIPGAKLIVGLRKPTDRVISHYRFCLREGLETEESFAAALAKEQQSTSRKGYLEGGLYYENLKRFFDTFGRSKIFVYLYDDLDKNTAATLRDIFSFLEVDASFSLDIEKRYNQGIVRRPRMDKLGIYQLLRGPSLPGKIIRSLAGSLYPKILENLTTVRFTPTIDQQSLAFLNDYYQKDLQLLQSILDKDITHWLAA